MYKYISLFNITFYTDLLQILYGYSLCVALPNQGATPVFQGIMGDFCAMFDHFV